MEASRAPSAETAGTAKGNADRDIKTTRNSAKRWRGAAAPSQGTIPLARSHPIKSLCSF